MTLILFKALHLYVVWSHLPVDADGGLRITNGVYENGEDKHIDSFHEEEFKVQRWGFFLMRRSANENFYGSYAFDFYAVVWSHIFI